MSLGNSVLLAYIGIRSAGCLPFITNCLPTPVKTTFTELLTTPWEYRAGGCCTLPARIYICGRAGVMKERELPKKKEGKHQGVQPGKGPHRLHHFGILSACFQLWLEAGTPHGRAATPLESCSSGVDDGISLPK